jgi:hypothetical protein
MDQSARNMIRECRVLEVSFKKHRLTLKVLSRRSLMPRKLQNLLLRPEERAIPHVKPIGEYAWRGPVDNRLRLRSH